MQEKRENNREGESMNTAATEQLVKSSDKHGGYKSSQDSSAGICHLWVIFE